jgi:hypothetical protein
MSPGGYWSKAIEMADLLLWAGLFRLATHIAEPPRISRGGRGTQVVWGESAGVPAVAITKSDREPVS